MLIDLHSHTWPRSHDSVLNPDDLVVRAKRAGLDAICFTEHDTLWDAASLKQIRERHDFLVLGGVEVGTDDGHILTFGIDRYSFSMHRTQELAGQVQQSAGAMVAAHPYRRQLPWYVGDEAEYQRALQQASQNLAYRHVCGLEVLNTRGSDKENAFSQRLAKLMQLPGTAGTDSHSIQDIGKCATYFEHTIHDERDLIRELQAGRFYAVDLRHKAIMR